MTQHANDAPDQVLKFVPKEKAQNKVPQVDEAGEVNGQLLQAERAENF